MTTAALRPEKSAGPQGSDVFSVSAYNFAFTSLESTMVHNE
jgi:hypothetical protein